MVRHVPRNDGIWRRYKVTTRNLPSTFRVKLTDLKQLDAERQTFKIYLSCMVNVEMEQQHWESGLRSLRRKCRARVRLHLDLDCESTLKLDTSKSALLPDAVFRFRVTHANTSYNDLVVEHIAGLGGAAAKSLAIRSMMPSSNGVPPSSAVTSRQGQRRHRQGRGYQRDQAEFQHLARLEVNALKPLDEVLRILGVVHFITCQSPLDPSGQLCYPTYPFSDFGENADGETIRYSLGRFARRGGVWWSVSGRHTQCARRSRSGARMFRACHCDSPSSDMDVLYVTDRAVVQVAERGPAYGYGRAQWLAYGSATVSVNPHPSLKEFFADSTRRDRKHNYELKVEKITQRGRFVYGKDALEVEGDKVHLKPQAAGDIEMQQERFYELLEAAPGRDRAEGCVHFRARLQQHLRGLRSSPRPRSGISWDAWEYRSLIAGRPGMAAFAATRMIASRASSACFT